MIAHVTANEPGALTYILHRSTADPNEFLFYEVYADQAALAVHGSSEAMQQFFAAIGGLLDGRPEITLTRHWARRNKASRPGGAGTWQTANPAALVHWA